MVTAKNQADYYKFNLQGNSIKLALNNLTNTTDLRVQLYDSKGNLLADSKGTEAQQTAYLNANSLLGLAAKSGDYSVKVSYAPISLKSLNQNYSLQLYSGTKFNASYQTTARVQASQTTHVAVDNTLTFATADAQSFSRQAFNQINSTALSAVNIGWLSANKSQLNVTSQVTAADQTDFYGFTFQQGSAIKLAFDNTTSTSNLRVQLLDVSGSRVLADSQGTTAQQAAYQQLTSSNGLSSRTGQYVVKVTYAAGANKSHTQNYNFQLSSGTSFSSTYQTVASAQTYGNYLLSGGTGAYNPASAAAAYFNGNANGTLPDLFQSLSTLI